MSSNSSQTSPQQQAMLDHLQHVQQVDERIFLGIQIAGGQILLPILVLTIIFSRKVTRHPVFINFCVSWIFSSIIYSMLVYKGRSNDDDLSLNPTYDACLIQAALINGVQALTVSSSLALVVHLWIILRFCAKSKNDPSLFGKHKSEMLYTFSILGIPFAVFVAFTVYSVVAGSAMAINEATEQQIPNSNLSVPGVFYCVILFNSNLSASITPGLGLVRATYIFSAVISLVTMCFEGLVAHLIFRQRVELRRISRGWLMAFLRVVLFSVYRILSICLNLAIILYPDELLLVGIAKNNLFNGVIDYVQAAIPLVAFLIFATEKASMFKYNIVHRF
ncbi:hypothetical protein EW145_g4191 [Phellinidium pouzarii]|uniref:G-protein coupled receptors family 1 profile domain-containing protein n=1 Tax=Phellinidium pouzarii TaxID=167371 RepID=A0A4S4L4D4_9AGAM|nr:hypothetical protein EW145_g4191 [Phellinidium pouzarii]